MSTKKATKRALLTSILAICLCLVMLIGSTFAWFTDTASTGVNKIQSGTLKVDIVDATAVNTSLDGGTLKWVRAKAAADEFETVDGSAILWEPGCTYQLQPFKIANKGNLDLKYKIEITGIDGSAELNKVIKWTINGAEISSQEFTLLAGENGAYNYSDAITLEGHMDENAGNDYQNLSINGIAITVYATQKNSESDSYGPDYDINATYPLAEISAITNAPMTAVTNSEGETTDYTYTNTGATVTATVPATAVAAGTTPTISIAPTTAPETVSTTVKADGKEAVAYEIKVDGATLSEANKATVSFFVGKGLKNVVVYHKNETTPFAGAQYDANTGFVTIVSAEFSPFTVAFDAPAAMVDGVAYDSLQAAVNAGGNVVLTKDADITKTGLTVAGTVTLNLNGHEIHAANKEPGNILVTGTLTLKDSVGTGKIWSDTTYVEGTADKTVIAVAGTFNMESGTIDTVNKNDPSNNGHFGVGLQGNATVNIKGGTIKSGWYAVAGNGQDVSTTGNINISGGTLISTADYAIYHPQSGTTTITGGVVDGAAGGVVMQRGTLLVTGGSIASKGTGDTGSWGDGTGGLSNAAIYLNAGYGDVTATIDSGATLVAGGNAVRIAQGKEANINLSGSHPAIQDLIG